MFFIFLFIFGSLWLRLTRGQPLRLLDDAVGCHYLEAFAENGSTVGGSGVCGDDPEADFADFAGLAALKAEDVDGEVFEGAGVAALTGDHFWFSLLVG